MTPKPTMVGEYQLVSPLGSGGMGDVYFAVSPTADRVAIKLIKRHLVTNPTVRDRFASEVESLKLVYGSRVARLENADLSGEPAWLAVEYIPGMTLREYVDQRGPLPLPLAAMTGAMLADGLAKVHQAGLLHRDLKPQNIILGPDGPVLIDFGLAVLLDRESYLTAPGELVGTPAFMSPERVKGDRELTPATDIYALAATLVFALTGHGLYPSMNSWGLLLRIADPDDLPDLSDVPTKLAPLIGAMLAFDPTARPTLDVARAGMLGVAKDGGVSVLDLRRRIAELTYVGSTELLVPPDLADPKKDPEADSGDETVVLPPDPRDLQPTRVDSDHQAKTRTDVTWLVDKLRRQYARRSTL